MTALCSLADVKAWLQTGQQPYPITDDAMLSRLIDSCSTFIETWLSRPIGLANWQEVRDGLGGQRQGAIRLAVTPVVAILSVTVDGLAVPLAPPISMQNARFTFGYTFSPTVLGIRGWNFPRGLQNVVIQYTAGYDPIPSDIQQACIELVVRKYKERTRVAERTRSLGGQETVAYETVTFTRRDLASDIQVLLSQYRMVVPMLSPTLLPVQPGDLVLEDGTTPVEDILLEDDSTQIEEEQ